MPDADRIGKLSYRWTRTFKKVYEGYYDLGEMTDEVMKSLVKDIKDYSDVPINLLKEASLRLNNIQSESSPIKYHNWKEEDQFIRGLASGYSKECPNQRAIDIAIRAFKDVLHDIRHNKVYYSDCYEESCKRYIRGIYEANFTGKIPMSSQTNLFFDDNIVRERLQEIDPIINDNIFHISKGIAKRGSIKRIMTKHKAAIRKPSLQDDILSIGRGA